MHCTRKSADAVLITRICAYRRRQLLTIARFRTPPHFSVVSSQVPAGVCERFKVTNSNKIPCTVRFAILAAVATENNTPPSSDNSKSKTPKGGKGLVAADVGAQSKADVTAFAIHPETWEIPPHEHRYVSTFFRPTEMRSYRSQFQAMVMDNDDPSTGR